MTDWAVGDLAVCINSAPCPIYGLAPYVKDQVYRVAKVKFATDVKTGVSGLGLKMVEHPEAIWRRADCFRRVVQPKQEACEPEFVTLLKRAKVTA